MKKRRNIWWTVQLIPHGKGRIQSYKFKMIPMMSLLCLIIFVLFLGVGTSIYFWNNIHDLNQQLMDQHSRMDEYIVENKELRNQLSVMNGELSDLYLEVMQLQEYISEVEELEQQIKQLEGLESSAAETAEAAESTEEQDKHSIVSVAGFSMDNARTSSAHLKRITPISTDELRLKILALRDKAETQHDQLADLKEQVEDIQYQALFIPAIPPANGRISSSYGWRSDPFNGSQAFHSGIDFVAYYRAPIYATAHGTVRSAGYNSGYGNQVVIDHGNGFQTSYSHLSAIEVSVGDQVERGDIIGRMGSTGRSTGVHLHYEVMINGTQVNPASYLTGGRGNDR